MRRSAQQTVRSPYCRRSEAGEPYVGFLFRCYSEPSSAIVVMGAAVAKKVFGRAPDRLRSVGTAFVRPADQSVECRASQRFDDRIAAAIERRLVDACDFGRAMGKSGGRNGN